MLRSAFLLLDNDELRKPYFRVNRMSSSLPEDSNLLLRMNRYDAKHQTLEGVRLTSPEKVLYPDVGITKLELAAYYMMVAKLMLPHLTGRPIVLVRSPEGKLEECFFQKHPRPGTPDTLRRIPVTADGKTSRFVVVDNAEALISLVQISAVEIHTWGSREDDLGKPDRLIIDLDPDISISWQRVIDAAFQIRGVLQELGLTSFVKTTGGKGLHIAVPLIRRRDWNEIKTFCRQLGELIVHLDPHNYTTNMTKPARAGKIYLDLLRNNWEATAIAPYSTRARADASVSVPIMWEQLKLVAKADYFTVRNLSVWISNQQHDPWDEMKQVKQNISKASTTMQRLTRK